MSPGGRRQWHLALVANGSSAEVRLPGDQNPVGLVCCPVRVRFSRYAGRILRPCRQIDPGDCSISCKYPVLPFCRPGRCINIRRGRYDQDAAASGSDSCWRTPGLCACCHLSVRPKRLITCSQAPVGLPSTGVAAMKPQLEGARSPHAMHPHQCRRERPCTSSCSRQRKRVAQVLRTTRPSPW